ncbi:hypothetical protein GIB67_028973 [Kingdonia uniflora]|uniref:Uncharacterized protein n=1 Tax=Kingdonia uniflora TaxID=39325 RepID=A0A7J7LBZ4_9MAGN|nr:hypothetical protein GIB67_028973 [Kingdonia uniflora]
MGYWVKSYPSTALIFTLDQSTRGKVGEVFKQASLVGLTVYRTSEFNGCPSEIPLSLR